MPEAPTEYYTSRYSGEEIDRGLDIAFGLDPNGTGIVSSEHGGTGGNTTQEALYNLGAGVRPNLLDNAYFVGGGTGWGVFPVNQTGETQWSSIGTTFDRWKSIVQGLIIDLNETGLSFSGSGTPSTSTFLSQKFSLTEKNLIVGDTLCLSILVGNQLYTGFAQVPDAGIDSYIIPCSDVLSMNLYSDQTGYAQFNFRISGQAQEVKAAKLELGSNQTLAYQDSDGNWQLLPQPDNQYGKQLLECQRYYSKSSQNIDGFSGGFLAETQPGSTEWLTISARFPVSMVNVPTVTVPWISKATNISQNLVVEGVIVQPNAVSESGFNLLNVQGLTLESGVIYLVQFSSDASL